MTSSLDKIVIYLFFFCKLQQLTLRFGIKSSTSKGLKKWSIWSLNTNVRLFNLLNKFFISFILSISFTQFLAQNINPLSLTIKLKPVYPKDLHNHVDVVKNHSKRILLNHCINFSKPYTVSFGKKNLQNILIMLGWSVDWNCLRHCQRLLPSPEIKDKSKATGGGRPKILRW